MGRQKKQKTIIINENVIDKIIDQEFSEMMDKNFTHYAFKVLEDRALPDARDGLKPSQRRTLYAMYHSLGLKANSKMSKCAKICGTISGDFHPHGEAVVYPTLVRMVQPWLLRYPLIKGQGNFGDVDGEPVAAMRYVEAKLSKAGEYVCQDVHETVVDYIPTYNDEHEEPVVLPSLLPNLLVNGTSGIAVGYASNMAPHNLREVTEVIKAYIKNPDLSVNDVLKIMPGPDFPTPCILLGQEGVKSYYETGRGTVKMEGLYEIDLDDNGKECIKITGFPYGASPKQFVKEVLELTQSKKIEGIIDLKNLSKEVNERMAINVIIWIAKNANAKVILNQLLKHTCLRQSFSINSTVLIDGRRVEENVPILKLVDVFVNHRVEVLRKKYIAELNKINARLHIIEGLISVSRKIDEVIKVIKSSDNKDDAKLKLISLGYVKTDEQASAIISIKLGDLTKLEAQNLEKEQSDLNVRSKWLQNVINQDDLILDLIVEEQDALAKTIGDDRVTQIGTEIDDIMLDSLIQEEQIVISLTRDGYIKRIPVTEYNIQKRGGRGVNNTNKKTEETDIIFVASTHDNIMFFTKNGVVYKKKGYQIPESVKTAKGMHVANLLQFNNPDEQVTNLIPLKSLDVDGYILMSTKNGLIKRSDIREYNTKFKERGIQAIKLKDDDSVACVTTTNGTQDIFLVTTHGKAIRYSEDQVRVTARVTSGVRAMKLAKDDHIADMLTIDPDTDPSILLITEKGYGKRSNSSEYREFAGRQAQGSAAINKLSKERNGLIVGALSVMPNDTLIMITAKGKIIQMPVKEIRTTGRTTSGVRVVRLEDENDIVNSITKVVDGALLEEQEYKEEAL